jgi:hypothetical protein
VVSLTDFHSRILDVTLMLLLVPIGVFGVAGDVGAVNAVGANGTVDTLFVAYFVACLVT